eukprot:2991997-Lingulodinium_polyedra.AAC.1
MAALPDAAIQDYLKVVEVCLRSLVFPAQCLVHLMALLRKKLGGFRTIGLLHSTVRTVMKLVGGEFR